MRITVQTILEFLHAGDSKEHILYQYPMLKEKDIDDCLHFAILLMSRKYAIKPIQSVEYFSCLPQLNLVRSAGNERKS